jgi:2-desacetyl-2-hydroxyethyl bacteriochlorophyllide A dehydrogenase
VHAAIVNGTHGFEIVELTDPVPRPRELVLRVDACGICGSDLKAYAAVPPGTVLGHEFCGEIVAVGREAGGWREGQCVAAMPLGSCGHCRWCHADLPAHCEHADRIGVGGGPGAFAEYVRVPTAAAVALHDQTGHAGALVEPLAVGLHTVVTAGLRSGDRVLVIGGGNVGAAVTVWARRLGAGDVVVSDPAPTRREAAAAWGASDVHDPTGGPPPDGFDVAFECVGAPGLIQSAIQSVVPRGRAVVAGVCLSPDEVLPAVALMKETEIRFAVYYGRREFAAAAVLLESGDLDPTDFVSSEVPLADIGATFERLLTTSTERKVLVAPNG